MDFHLIWVVRCDESVLCNECGEYNETAWGTQIIVHVSSSNRLGLWSDG